MLSLLLVSRRRSIDSVSLFPFPFPFVILAIEVHCEQSIFVATRARCSTSSSREKKAVDCSLLVDRMRHDCDAKQRAEGFVPSTELTILDLRLEIVADECLDSLPRRLQLA